MQEEADGVDPPTTCPPKPLYWALWGLVAGWEDKKREVGGQDWEGRKENRRKLVSGSLCLHRCKQKEKLTHNLKG